MRRRAPSIAGGMVSEQFRKKKVVDAAAIWRKTQLSKRTNGPRSRATEAEKIVQEGLERFGLSESDLKSSPGSDPRKVAIAGFIHQSTTTPPSWTAERLQMKSAANVSQQLSRAKKAAKPKIKPAKPVV
jgi:putative transposase